MIESIHKEQCTGCKMCADLCPKDAICFKEDYAGYWYPIVDDDKCTRCGICIAKCPSLHQPEEMEMDPNVYAAWIKNKEERLNCTSGGICYELSRFVLQDGGYVAGVQYSDDCRRAEYNIIDCVEDLHKITQTKYFQADSEKIYCKIKKLLDLGKTVLFVGTPCCNAALTRYLSRSYNNLIQCDFICRGIPSPKVHRIEVDYMKKKYSSQVVSFHEKNKKKGWSCFGTLIKFKNGNEYYRDRYNNPMTDIFTRQDMNVREVCYQCQYRNLSRQADVTVGDFWGIDGIDKEDYFYGVSVLMLNTSKGEACFEAIKDNLEYVEKSVKDVAKGNPALFNQLHKNPKRDQFFKDMNSLEFEQVLSKYVPSKFEKFKHKLMTKAKKIYKIIRLLGEISISKFVYYNFLCNNISRGKGCYFIPYSGSCVDIDRTAKIYLNGNFFLNSWKIKGSKAESTFKMKENAILKIKGNVELAYNSDLHINQNAYMEIGSMTANVGTAIICSSRIEIGEDVMIGRNVVIYDSDYHKITSRFSKKKTNNKPVIIGDHVWIGSKAMLMKGSKIDKNSIIGANSWVAGHVKQGSLVSGFPDTVVMEGVNWQR